MAAQYTPVREIKQSEVGVYRVPAASVRVDYGTVTEGGQLLTTKVSAHERSNINLICVVRAGNFQKQLLLGVVAVILITLL